MAVLHRHRSRITRMQFRIGIWRMAPWSVALLFADFREAMSFVNSVAAVAERAGHHPDIDIRYNKVKLALASHDAGGITEKDFSLAYRDRECPLNKLPCAPDQHGNHCPARILRFASNRLIRLHFP
jgi:4a-hydroxytetrahydrobiopterin dehydratase